MYGGGLKHNCRVIIDCITYKKGSIYQHATIGGSDSIHNDMAFGLALVPSDLTRALKEAGIDVLDVRATGPSVQTAYAKIRAHTGGDSKQALYVMLTCSRQTLPKIAMVFDEDVDIWNDAQLLQAQAYRFDAASDVLGHGLGLGIRLTEIRAEREREILPNPPVAPGNHAVHAELGNDVRRLVTSGRRVDADAGLSGDASSTELGNRR